MSSLQSSLRVALVGSGSMGFNHARTIAASPQTELAVVVDPFEDNGRRVAELYDARWASDLDGLGQVDAVVIAASTEHHLELALPIIEAGLPVLVEKPVCPSLADTEEVLAASRKAGTPLMCGLLERFNPAVSVAMSMMNEPRYVRAERHSPYVARIRTGVAWDLLVHDVDLVVRAFGAPPEAADVQVGYFHPDSAAGAEDVVETALRFGGGGIASVSASRIGQTKTRRMQIQELDRMIEVDLLRRGVTVYRHSTIDSEEGRVGFRQMTEIEVPEVIGAEPLASQLEHFVGLVQGRIDADAERDSILPAHVVVDRVLKAAGAPS